MQKMSRKKFLLITCSCYLLLYILFKLILVYQADLYMNNDIYNKSYGIGDVLEIKTYDANNEKNTDYFTPMNKTINMKVKNYFKEYEKGDSDSNYEFYYKYREDGGVDSAIMLGVYPSNISLINTRNEDVSFFEFNYFPMYVSEILRDSFLDRHNVNNDIDLIKYIRSRDKKKNNFFTPIYIIKERYFFDFIESTLPSLDNITYIEGDLNGYIYENDSYRQVCILKNKKVYVLSFYKMDDEIVLDVLNSFKIT